MVNNNDDDDTSPPPVTSSTKESNRNEMNDSEANESAALEVVVEEEAAAQEAEHMTCVTDTVTDLVKHIINLGNALKCPICCQTMKHPVCLAVCMHAFCKTCILSSLQTTLCRNKCPTCRCVATRRSLLDCPELKRLSMHYKQMLPSFGLVGAEYSADVQMTQIEHLPEGSDCDGESDDDDDDDDEPSDNDEESDEHGAARSKLERLRELMQVNMTMQSALQAGMPAPVVPVVPVPVPLQHQPLQHQQHAPNSDSARRASAIAAIMAANNNRNNNNNNNNNNSEQKWVLENLERVIEVNRRAFERIEQQDQQKRRRQRQQQQQQQLMLSQNMHAAREQENADALEYDEDEQEWRYPGQYYERANSKVTFAEVFGDEEEKDRKMPPSVLAVDYGDSTTGNRNDDNQANDNDNDESSLEEFQSAVQELPVEHTTSPVAHLPACQEDEEEESNSIAWNDATPSRRRTPESDRRQTPGSNTMSTAKTPFRSNKTNAAHQTRQVPARLALLMPVMATPTTTITITNMTPTTDISRPEAEASPVSLDDDRRTGTPIPAVMESSSEPANSPNLVLQQEECSTEDVPMDEDSTMQMQGVVHETTAQNDDAQAVDVPVVQESCSPTTNANDARVENNNDDAQAVSEADVPVVQECPTANANDARVESDGRNNDDAQAVSVADIPIQECPTVSANDACAKNDDSNHDANVPTGMDIDEENSSRSEPVARSDAAVAAASSNPSDAATALAPETPASQQQFAKSVFAEGTVVLVQARTWPGVNKHGGVGRITRVQTSLDGIVKYDVKYVLGGCELSLEETFFSLYNDERGTKEVDEKDEGVGASGARKSYRLESKEDSIPPHVLANLKAEGFNVDGVAVPSGTDNGVRRRLLASGDTKSLNANNRSSKRKLRTAESGPAASKENAKPAAKKTSGRGKSRETAHVAAKGSSKTSNKSVANKRKSVASLGNEKGKKRKAARSSTVVSEGIQIAATAAALELTNEQKCENADLLYMDSITVAIQNKVIIVGTSGLSETDMEALKKLCNATRNNDVKVKHSETFNSDKTTLCVISVNPHGAANGGNLEAGKRTLKAMQAALAGVPLVSPAWITSFGKSGQFVSPDSSMFVRTLPTKTTREDHIMEYGVSAIAAAIRLSRVQEATFRLKILTDVSVCLCGPFQPAITKLLREADAEVVTASKTAAKLSADGDPKVVLLCSDNDGKIPDSVESKVKIHKSQVQVVNVDWLFDSISCGSVLTAGAYQPKMEQAKKLWALTKDAH